MKRNAAFCIVMVLALYGICLAKSAGTIPLPGISMSEAVKAAQDYFYNEETRAVSRDYFKVSEYILLRAEYTNDFEDGEWGWKIVFVHPRQTDHSVAYKVTNGGKLVFLYATK